MTEQTVTRTTLADHRLAASTSIAHVEVRRISIAPGVEPGAHWHNGPVFGVIESGSVMFRVEGAAERTLGPGDTFFEPSGTTIARFDATGEGVTFLAWFPLPEGVSPELVMGEVEGMTGIEPA